MKYEKVSLHTYVQYGSSHYYIEQYSLFHIIFRHHTHGCSILRYNPLEKKSIKKITQFHQKNKNVKFFSI